MLLKYLLVQTPALPSEQRAKVTVQLKYKESVWRGKRNVVQSAKMLSTEQSNRDFCLQQPCFQQSLPGFAFTRSLWHFLII